MAFGFPGLPDLPSPKPVRKNRDTREPKAALARVDQSEAAERSSHNVAFFGAGKIDLIHSLNYKRGAPGIAF